MTRKCVAWTFALLLALMLGADTASAVKKKGKGPAPAPLFYPSLPNTPRLQFLATYNGDQDIKKKSGRFLRFVLGEEERQAAIEKPYGAVFHDKKLYVCDIRQGLVWIFDFEKNDLSEMGRSGSGRLSKPSGIAVDASGTSYVADVGLRRVVVFDDHYRYVRAYGDPETLKPTDVVISGDSLYVCSVDEGVVVVFDRRTGDEVRRIGRRGSQAGELFFPTNLALDTEDNLYVSDTGNARVMKFTLEGEFLKQYGSLGLSHGTFTRPKGVALDRENRLYVVDAAFENVQIFDNDGGLLLYFGESGAARGNLTLPADVSIDYSNVDLFQDRVAPGYRIEYLVIVTNHFGPNKVNVYGFITEEGSESPR